jgi:hypothetical protein
VPQEKSEIRSRKSEINFPSALFCEMLQPILSWHAFWLCALPKIGFQTLWRDRGSDNSGSDNRGYVYCRAM